jgi:hypothetical protein
MAPLAQLELTSHHSFADGREIHNGGKKLLTGSGVDFLIVLQTGNGRWPTNSQHDQ